MIGGCVKQTKRIREGTLCTICISPAVFPVMLHGPSTDIFCAKCVAKQGAQAITVNWGRHPSEFTLSSTIMKCPNCNRELETFRAIQADIVAGLPSASVSLFDSAFFLKLVFDLTLDQYRDGVKAQFNDPNLFDAPDDKITCPFADHGCEGARALPACAYHSLRQDHL